MATLRTLRSFTEDELRAFVAGEERRLELDRESRQITAANDLLRKDLKEAFVAEGKATFKRGEFVAVLEDKVAQVAWKEEFLRECGAGKAAAVAKSVGTTSKAQVRKA